MSRPFSRSMSLLLLPAYSFIDPSRERSVADNDSFSNAFSKLIELGVPTVQFAGKPWEMGQK